MTLENECFGSQSIGQLQYCLSYSNKFYDYADIRHSPAPLLSLSN